MAVGVQSRIVRALDALADGETDLAAAILEDLSIELAVDPTARFHPTGGTWI